METIQKNKGWFIAIIILVIVNIATLSTLLYLSLKEKNIPFANMPKNSAGAEFLIQSLELNEEQTQKFSVLKKEHQVETRNIREQQKVAREAFFLLLKDSLTNTKKVEEASGKISVYDSQLNLITFNHFKQVRALCSNSQQKKFDSLIIKLMHQILMPKPPKPNARREDDPHFSPNQPPPPREDEQVPPPRRDREDGPPPR